jgi:hypothetical protein
VRGTIVVQNMSLYASTEFADAAAWGDAAARHLRIWLAASGNSYDATARELFVRTHPVLFGRDCDLALRGYDRWRWRRRLQDTAATFARFMGPRQQRWITEQGTASAIPPCLIGGGDARPCWALGQLQSSSAQAECKAAA